MIIFEPVWNPILKKWVVETREDKKKIPYFFENKEKANSFAESLIKEKHR